MHEYVADDDDDDDDDGDDDDNNDDEASKTNVRYASTCIEAFVERRCLITDMIRSAFIVVKYSMDVDVFDSFVTVLIKDQDEYDISIKTISGIVLLGCKCSLRTTMGDIRASKVPRDVAACRNRPAMPTLDGDVRRRHEHPINEGFDEPCHRHPSRRYVVSFRG